MDASYKFKSFFQSTFVIGKVKLINEAAKSNI